MTSMIDITTVLPADVVIDAIPPLDGYIVQVAAIGTPGPPGATGPAGAAGANGTNVPAGGTPDGNEAISISSSTNYVNPGTHPLGTGKIAADNGYLNTTGASNSGAVAVGASTITGDIDLRIFFPTAPTFTSGSFQSMLNLAGAIDFRLQSSNGKPQVWVSHDGGASSNVAGVGTATPPAALGWLATWRASDGQVNIYALDSAGAVTTADGKKWTQVGSPATATASGSLTPGAKDVGVGALANNGSEPMALHVSRIEVRSGLDGTLVVGTDFSGHDTDAPVFTDATSKVWTLTGNAGIVEKKITATQNSVTTTPATLGDLARGGVGAKTYRRNPINGKYQPYKYGDVGTGTTATQQRTAIHNAYLAAKANGKGIVAVDDDYTVDANTSLLDPVSGLPYTALMTWDNVHYEGAGKITLANGANCHIFGHPGRTQTGTGQMDHIDNVVIAGITLDGNKANQTGTCDHDLLHLPQHPNMRLYDIEGSNADGKGIYSSALGEFYNSALTSDPGVNIVRPVYMSRIRMLNCAAWAFFLSATNRETKDYGLHAEGCGTAQARIPGRTVAVNITANGNLVIQVDNFSVQTIALTAGQTPANVVTAINTALAGNGTASLTSQGRMLITSPTSGTASRVYIQNTSTTSVLTNLGYTINPKNGDNNYRAGGNEFGGFFHDHSQTGLVGAYADSNLGDGHYIHNVNFCDLDLLAAVSNNGIGIYVNEFVSSNGHGWASAMNCVALGYASYRTAADSAEVYLDSGTVGYGLTRYSTITSGRFGAEKDTLGSASDNRHANNSLYIADSVGVTLDGDVFDATKVNIMGATFADGGIVRNVRTPSGYTPNPPGGGGGGAGALSYTTAQSLTTGEVNQALRNLKTAKIIEPEQFNTGTDAGNLQAAINYGASATDYVCIRLRTATYTMGTGGNSTDALTYDGTHGNLYIDARGARIIYQGTGALLRSSVHTGGNNPPRITVMGGYWEGLTAAYGFHGTDVRAFTFIEPDVSFPVGAAFYQLNVDTWCERNTYERVNDIGSRQLLVCDVADWVSTSIAVTITASTDRVAFTTAHKSVVGSRLKFTGISGGAPLVNGTTYYVQSVVDANTVTLSATLGGALLNITSDGTAAGWITPAASMARTRLFEARLTDGVATYCKTQIKNGAGCYDSHFSGRGNIPDGVGVIDVLGAGTMGNTDLDFRCEAVTNLAGGAFFMRWGQASGAQPTLSPDMVVSRLNVFDPLATAPDGSQKIFAEHAFQGVTSKASQLNSYLDMYGRTSRATLGVPINPSAWITDGSGVAGHPDDQFGNLVLTPGASRHIYVDVSGGTGTEVYQQLDTVLVGDADPRLAAVPLIHSRLVNATGVNGGGGIGDQTLATATTIPATSLSTSTFLRYSLDGTLDGVATSGNMTIKVKVNGTNIWSGLVSASQTGAGTNKVWSIEGKIYVLATGVSGSLMSAQWRTSITAAGGQASNPDQQAATTIDISAGLTVTIICQFATANAGNIVRLPGGFLTHVR